METPLEDRELVVLAITVVALFYAGSRLRREMRLAGSGWLVGALIAMTIGLVATNLESFFRDRAALGLNIVEHVGYLAHTLCLIAFLLSYRRKAP